MTVVIKNNIKQALIPLNKDIPGEWEVLPIRGLFFETDLRSMSGDETLLSVSQYTGVTKREDNIDMEVENLTHASTLEGYKIVKEKDLVINIMLAWNGSLAISNHNGITSPAYATFRAKAGVHPEYFHYLFRTEMMKKEFKRFSTGIIDSRLRLYPDSFLRIYTIKPTLQAQVAIANFLDQKIKQINTYIGDKRKLINLLKEQKQAVIQDAVTKGIDPNLKMKHSGVPWIGEIPEDWKIRKLKYCVQLNKWKSVDKIERKVALENIESWTRRFIETDGDFQGEGSFIKPNDILFGKLRPYLAKVLLSDFTGVCVNEILVFTPNQTIINPVFLSFLCISSEFIKTVDSSTYGSKMPRAEWSFIGNLSIAIPPLQIQKDIVQHIEQETSEIDIAIEKIEKEIALIEEYSTSLIYQAVTGKINIS